MGPSLPSPALPGPAGPRLAGSVGLAAQEVPEHRGVVAAGLRLRQLDGVKRTLMVGAHPDDEDTSLIAALARGHGAEVAYLSLSRGEGGQNLIGPELDEGLGIVRTGELLAARSLDGGRQYFTRAFDFGYSKSAEETFRYWPRREVVGDVVWMIRRFRPQVVVSVFDGENPGGHGQHQVAGIATYEAFDAAGDPARFPEQLTGADAVDPWSPLKLYRSSRFDRDETTLALETGRFDPLLGRSHFQLSMESRSQHRSQDFGVPEPMGARAAPLTLVKNRTGASGGLFAGVDTALLSLADGLHGDHADHLRALLDQYREAVRTAEAGLDALEPWASVEALGRAAQRMERAVASAAEADAPTGVRRTLEDRLERVREALLSAAGVVVDVRADDDLVVPGEVLELEVAVWNGGPFPVPEARAELALPEGWSAEPLGPESVEADDSFRARLFGPDPASIVTGPSGVEPGDVVRWRYRARVPEDAEPSRLYYLARPRDGQMYRWPEDRSLWGLPRNPPLLEGSVELSLGAATRVSAGSAPARPTGHPRSASTDSGAGGEVRVRVRRAGDYVGVDPARGEFRRPVLVAPAVSVRLRPRVMAWPLGEGEARSVTVSLESQARAGARGRLRLEAPRGWTVEPRSVSFDFTGPGEGRSTSFRVRAPESVAEGTYELAAVAETEAGRRYAEGFEVVDYPHIRRALLFEDARTRVSVFPVRVDRDLRLGYVMGSGDDGAEALRQLGIDVTLLGPEEVREADFAAYDVIVLGVRAYETRPDLVSSNAQLLDWVEEGGTLLVQYNKYEFSGAGYAPYPIRISRPHDRVTDETAPVTLLDPDSPVFTSPNRITGEDFEGWAQERGLYFLGTWDERYTPLLSMHDPGEVAKRGSLLVAPVGDGLWIYTGLAFFRQFPEGVPGAYRLFANLVSLEASEWRAR